MTVEELIKRMETFHKSGGNTMDFEVRMLDGSILPVQVDIILQRFDVVNQENVMSIIMYEEEV